jgi:hypothetical protein
MSFRCLCKVYVGVVSAHHGGRLPIAQRARGHIILSHSWKGEDEM